MKKLIVGNWKMNPGTLAEAKKAFEKIRSGAVRLRGVETVICPPAVYLAAFSAPKGMLGAQDVFYEVEGAHTGELSAPQLKSAGVKYVIVGHSERRALGESDEVVNKKVRAALAASLIPILCVGERVRDPEHRYLHDVREQLRAGVRGVLRASLPKVVVAYEPVWAIGKGAKALDASEALHMNLYIKKALADIGGDMAGKTRILYGGSVDAANAVSFLTEGKMDGLLVGRESLTPAKFLALISHADEI
ncbi:triose-phosphate isomerase [Candidatus Parcubacteria bacterium]|nr:triose-phosphate isomerase [Candidatus Parcubacteria bacterium]